MADRVISVTIAGDASKLNAALGSAQKSLDQTNQHLATTTKTVSTAAKAFVLFEGAKKAAEFLKGAAEAAVTNETAMTRSGVAVKNAGENWKRLKDPIDKALTSMSTTGGFMKSDLANAFSKIELATHNHTKALGLEKDAMNVSAQTGKPLSLIALALGKAWDGSSTALTRLGIITPKVTTAQDALRAQHDKLIASGGKLSKSQTIAYNDALKAAKAADKQASSTSALDYLHKKFAGAVAERSQTMAGKLAIFQAKWEEIKVKVGDAILPALLFAIKPVLTILDKLSGLSDTWKTVILAVGGAVATLTAGLLVYAAVVKINTIAQEAWDAAMAANPIGLVVIAIAGLIAAMVILYERSSTVRAIMNAAFKDIKSVGETVFGFFTNTLFPAFAAAWEKSGGVVGTVVGAIKGYVKGVVTTVEGVFNFVGDLIHGRWSKLWGDAGQIVSGLIGMIKSQFLAIPKAILSHLGDIAGAAKSLGSAIYDGIIGAIEGLPSALSNVVRAGFNALKNLIESFHVSVKTKSILGVDVPIGMSLGFGGGNASSGPSVALPSVSFAGAGGAGTGGLAAPGGAGSSKSFLSGNLPHVSAGASAGGGYTFPTGGAPGGSGGAGGSGASKASAALSALKSKLQAVATAAAQVAQQVQGRMDAAFTHVKDFALKAFDGATQTGLQKLTDRAAAASKTIQDDLQKKLDSLNDANAALTPAEAALKAIQDAHNQAGLTDASTQAAAGLTAAQATGDATAIAAAQKAVDDAAYNQRVADLSVTAAAERKAANDKLKDDQLAAQNDAATKAKIVADQLKQDQLNYQASRDVKKTALDAQLVDLQAHLDKHPKLWATTHAKVMKMFADDFGPDFQTAGANIGASYIKGLKDAFAAVDPLTGQFDKAGAAAAKATKAAAHPHLADGGIIHARPGGTLVLVGEAGRDEAVVPLPAGGRLGGGNTFNIYNPPALDARALAAAILWRGKHVVT